MAESYEGRPLPRPYDEVVDQGLGFDLRTLRSRRRALRFLGLGAAAAGLAACGTGTSGSSSPASSSSAPSAPGQSGTSGEIPEETAGPYPGDGSNGPDVLAQSGIVRGDIRSSFGEFSGTAQGVPMTLELIIADLANGGSPFAGVAVYVWHCTREGGYSLYSEGVEDQNFLRGVQIADDAGSVANLSRVSLDGDNVFGGDGGALQLATVSGDGASGYTVTLAVGVDTTTEPGGPGGPPPSR